MEPLYRLLEIPRGVTAIIGSGGKTSLMYTLAEELRPLGTVLLTTTTHILPPDQYPLAQTAAELTAALKRCGVACVGTPAPEGKLAAPDVSLWETAADFVLVEADGSRHLPAKAHAPWEPVLPPECRRVVCVLGASCFGQPIGQAAHRPDRYAALAGVTESDVITPAVAARVLAAESRFDVLYVNQMDEECVSPLLTRPLTEALSCPVVVGSLHRRRWQRV